MVINGGRRGALGIFVLGPKQTPTGLDIFLTICCPRFCLQIIFSVELCSAVLVLGTGAEYFPILVSNISGAHTFGFPTK